MVVRSVFFCVGGGDANDPWITSGDRFLIIYGKTSYASASSHFDLSRVPTDQGNQGIQGKF